MREKHLRSIDLNLLPVLDALLRHRNASRAGREVGLSQPAMSRALGRLRDLLEDPLLVRGPGGLLLSPRAEALQPALAAILTELRGLLAEPAFDPSAERRTMRIAMTDAQASLLLAPLIARVTAQAPGVLIEWVPIAAGVGERMAKGEVDLALALDTTPLPGGAASSPLMEDRLATVVRQGHPCGGQWSLADYARYPSVIVSLLGDRTSDMDAELAASGIERPIAAIVPNFRAAAEIVASCDAVTTISRAFAATLPLPLVLIEPPLGNIRLSVVMIWARFRGNDPLLEWLRAQLAAVSASAGAQTAPMAV
ncbi:MAG: LysR family transcriptional regulator [Sphingomonas sp.]|uniref:LysR family transcriptional regulator n=1 Tax=Sphingomonas sp. TaxID=28214 RepID=UPI0025F300FE|nr:LysR family transcriptional regulator [Sphingomonas sp.]MBX9882957.1 LysR family transcriptional regulator [Sphingomonas sp.]